MSALSDTTLPRTQFISDRVFPAPFTSCGGLVPLVGSPHVVEGVLAREDLPPRRILRSAGARRVLLRHPLRDRVRKRVSIVASRMDV